MELFHVVFIDGIDIYFSFPIFEEFYLNIAEAVGQWGVEFRDYFEAEVAI